MADQKINIAIGSTFSGAGMSQALTGVDKLSKSAGKAASAVGSLGNALGGIGGKAGQAIGAVTKLTSALAMGGPIGLAVAGVTALVGAFINYKEKQEEAAKAADEHAKKLKELQDEAARKAWKDFVDEIARGRVESNMLLQSLEKIVDLENSLNSAKNNSANSASNVKLTQLQAQHNAEARGASSSEEEQIIRARNNVKMAEAKGQANIDAAQGKLDQVRTQKELTDKSYSAMIEESGKITTQIQRLTSDLDGLDKKIANAKDEVNQAQGLVDNLQGTNGQDKEKAQKLLTEEQDNLKKLQEEQANKQKLLNDTLGERKKLDDKILATGYKIAGLKEEEKVANDNLTIATTQAADSVANAKDAARKLMGKLLEAHSKASEQARNEKEAAEKAEAIKKIDEEIKVAKENLKAAIQRAEQAFANANIDLSLVYRGAVGGTPAGGGTGDAEKDNQTAERQAKGMSKSVNWGTGRAFDADKAARYKKSHGNEFGGFSQKDQRDYDDLKAKEARGRIGDKDRERLKKYRERDPELKAQEEAKKAAEAAKKLKELEEAKKQLQEDAYQSMIDVADYVADIYDYVSEGPQ